MFALYRANASYARAVLAGQVPSGGTAADDALAAAAIAAIRTLGPSARAPTCATAEQGLERRRLDLEVEDTYVVSWPQLSFSQNGSDLNLNWLGLYKLQNATDVTGPYGNVFGSPAAAPFTTNMTSQPKVFFRLTYP